MQPPNASFYDFICTCVMPIVMTLIMATSANIFIHSAHSPFSEVSQKHENGQSIDISDCDLDKT